MPTPDPLAIAFLLSALAFPWLLGLVKLTSDRNRWRFPTVTLVALMTVAAMVVVMRAMPGLLPYLTRNRSLLENGEVWRALTALFIHRVPLGGVIFNMTILAVTGTIAEQHFRAGRWIAVYLGAGIVTEFLALVWEPEGGGNSIAVYGLAGALSLLPGKARSVVQPTLRIAAFASGAGLLILHDVHGIGFLAGAAIAAVLSAQDFRLRNAEEEALLRLTI